MNREITLIHLLGRDARPPAWLLNGIPTGSAVHCLTTVADAHDALWRGEIRTLVCEMEDGAGRSTESLLEAAAQDFPSVSTVALVTRGAAATDALLRIARTGVHALFFDEDRRSPIFVRRALLEARERCRQAILWDRIGADTPDRVRPLVVFGLKNATRSMSVDDAAGALGLHRKTLHDRCTQAGTLPPQQILGWCRMLAAAVLLEDRGRPVDHIALELQFPSGAAFRNMLKRYTGLNPQQLRKRGTISEMSRLFARAVAPASLRHADSKAG